jgi:hypothetical protein
VEDGNEEKSREESREEGPGKDELWMSGEEEEKVISVDKRNNEPREIFRGVCFFKTYSVNIYME